MEEWASDGAGEADDGEGSARSGDSGLPSLPSVVPVPSNALSPEREREPEPEQVRGRRVAVRPLSEPDDDEPSFTRWQKETPIEREIRLAREREDELRREKGLPPVPANAANVAGPAATPRTEAQRFITPKNVVMNDCRSVQHRIATSRIQQEINETTEREKELHAAGLIQTISEDTVDSKVTRFTDLAGYAIEEKERKLRRAVSSSAISQELENSNGTTSPGPTGPKSPFSRAFFESSSNQFNKHSSSSPKKSSARIGHKGVMQRFLASRGRISPVTYSQSSPFTSVRHSSAFSPLQSAKLILEPTSDVATSEEFDGGPKKNVRHGYLSAEKRIQTELQEMQKREEELRLQRKNLAQSQPNLLSIGNFEDLNGSLKNENGSSDSNSFEENSMEKTEESSLPNWLHQGNKRNKISLIAQWEYRIQQSSC